MLRGSYSHLHRLLAVARQWGIHVEPVEGFETDSGLWAGADMVDVWNDRNTLNLRIEFDHASPRGRVVGIRDYVDIPKRITVREAIAQLQWLLVSNKEPRKVGRDNGKRT